MRSAVQLAVRLGVPAFDAGIKKKRGRNGKSKWGLPNPAKFKFKEWAEADSTDYRKQHQTRSVRLFFSFSLGIVCDGARRCYPRPRAAGLRRKLALTRAQKWNVGLLRCKIKCEKARAILPIPFAAP
jgi:hypothetical protein